MATGGDDDTIAGSQPTATAVQAVVPERVANRYEIVRWLGSGGMGRVYEARDTELGETVALKVLRSGLSDDSVARFRREVRLTRKIQHPNVARMHDIGEHDGDRFLTMELVEGEPLTRRLGRPMEWLRLVGIAQQLCAGLAAAHDKGVVHRDLKPDNVLIERGTERAVITDFGIARSIDDPSVTQEGSVVGTPRYMSPEQLHGRDVDARSDLFSLGVILFELTTGERPWPGDNAITIAVAQATRPARPIANAAVPPQFAFLVSRCLELEPDRRPASARELGDALAALANLRDDVITSRHTTPTQPPGAPTAQTKPITPPTPTARTMATTVAVLPLACASGDEYLADGVHEDLIDTLSATAGLRVRPAGVVRAANEPDPRALGRELGVDHVVVGSLRRISGHLRVAVRLIGVDDGFQIWAHKADGDEAAVLQISEQVARGIATALSTRAAPATRPTDPRAVDLYLRAKAELRLFWASHIQNASDLLDQAHEISPSSAPIAGARAYAATQAWVMSGEAEGAPHAREAIEHGLTLGHAEAYLASAAYKLNIGDMVGGAADLGTALVRAPMLGQAHEMAGRLLVEIAAVSEARKHFETARSLDPQRAHIHATELARLDALEGNWERADQAVAVVAADPDRAIAQLGAIFGARLAMWRNERDSVIESLQRFAPRMVSYASSLIGYVSDVVVSGKIDPVVLRGFTSQFGGADRPLRNQIMGLQLLAEVAMVLGNPDVTYDMLEQADALGLCDVVVLDRCPLFEPVLEQRRFRQIREKVGNRAAAVLAAYRSTAG